MVKWFRAMGRDHQARMNAVLEGLHAGDEVAGDRQPEGPRLEGGRDVQSYLRDHRAGERMAYTRSLRPTGIVGMTTAETDKPFKASESIGGNAVR